MKFSDYTLNIMRNFSLINQSLVVKEPEYLITTNDSLSITALTKIIEELPNFAIYRTQDFLNSISLFEDKENINFEFKEKWIEIKHKNNKIKFITTHHSLIQVSQHLKPAKDYLDFNKFNSGFDITFEEIKRIKKAASILFSNIAKTESICLKIKTVDEKVLITLETNETYLQNNYEVVIENFEGEEIDIKLPVDSLLLFNGDYKVQLFNNRMAKFSHKELELFYFIMSVAE